MRVFRKEEGVGCEACHGPGSEYMKSEIMEDREQFLKHGGIIPDEARCKECHGDDEFHFEERLEKIAHPKPDEKGGR
jgi:hypothetical protein